MLLVLLQTKHGQYCAICSNSPKSRRSDTRTIRQDMNDMLWWRRCQQQHESRAPSCHNWYSVRDGDKHPSIAIRQGWRDLLYSATSRHGVGRRPTPHASPSLSHVLSPCNSLLSLLFHRAQPALWHIKGGQQTVLGGWLHATRTHPFEPLTIRRLRTHAPFLVHL